MKELTVGESLALLVEWGAELRSCAGVDGLVSFFRPDEPTNLADEDPHRLVDVNFLGFAGHQAVHCAVGLGGDAESLEVDGDTLADVDDLPRMPLKFSSGDYSVSTSFNQRNKNCNQTILLKFFPQIPKKSLTFLFVTSRMVFSFNPWKSLKAGRVSPADSTGKSSNRSSAPSGIILP